MACSWQECGPYRAKTQNEPTITQASTADQDHLGAASGLEEAARFKEQKPRAKSPGTLLRQSPMGCCGWPISLAPIPLPLPQPELDTGSEPATCCSYIWEYRLGLTWDGARAPCAGSGIAMPSPSSSHGSYSHAPPSASQQGHAQCCAVSIREVQRAFTGRPTRRRCRRTQHNSRETRY